MIHSYTPKISFFLLGLMLSVWGISDVYGQKQNSASDIEMAEAKTAYIDGLSAFENKNYRQALPLLKKAYLKLADQPGVNFALSDLFYQMGDLTNAEYYGKQAVQLSPHNSWYRLKLVEIYKEAGKSKTALTELKEARRYHPNNSDLLHQLAEVYTEVGQLKEANRIYNRLIFLEGESIRLRKQRLQNFNKLGMRDSTLAELNRIREQNPRNPGILNTLARHYMQMNRQAEAKELLIKSLNIHGYYYRSAILLAEIYFEQENWARAEQLLNTFSGDSSISENDKVRMGRFLFTTYENHPNSEKLQHITKVTFKKLVTSADKSIRLLSMATDFFIATKQFDSALEATEKINRLNPSDDSAWKTRLELLLRSGKIEQAIEVGEQAAREIPQDPFILYFLGYAQLAGKQYQKSINNLNKAITLPSRRNLKSGIRSALGDAHAKQKNWTEAFENYKASLKFNPDNAIVLNNYAYYLSLQKKELNKARKMASKALSLDQGNASYLDTLGWIHFQLGNFKKSERYIRKAIQAGKPNAETMEHLGDVLFELGKQKEAHKWWQKALKKDSTRIHLKEKLSN